MKVLGEKSSKNEYSLIEVKPSNDFINSIVAVLQPIESTEMKDLSKLNSELVNSNMAGLINILHIDVASDSMTILSPCPGSLPSNYLLLGSIKHKMN